MTKPVITCAPTDSLNHVARLMWEHDCGAVPVVNHDGETIAMITDRDICMAAYTQGKRLSEIPASTAASRSLVSTLPDDSLGWALELMQLSQLRRIPVLETNGTLVGILSLADVARGYAQGRTNSLSATPIAMTLGAVSHMPPSTPRASPPRVNDVVFRVKPGEGGWMVVDRSGAVLAGGFEAQRDAVIHAKELTRHEGVAQVIVYDEADKLQSEFFYSKDERPALASDDLPPTMAASKPTRIKPRNAEKEARH